MQIRVPHDPEKFDEFGQLREGYSGVSFKDIALNNITISGSRGSGNTVYDNRAMYSLRVVAEVASRKIELASIHIVDAEQEGSEPTLFSRLSKLMRERPKDVDHDVTWDAQAQDLILGVVFDNLKAHTFRLFVMEIIDAAKDAGEAKMQRDFRDLLGIDED